MVQLVYEKIKENKVIAGLLLAVLALMGFFFSQSHPPTNAKELDFPKVTEQVTVKTPSSADKGQKNVSSQSSKITVDIKGAVQKEGIYTLAANSRLNDLVQLAGGFSKEADRKSVNLAQKLKDEEVVYVAYQGENISIIPEKGSTNSAVSETGQGKINLNTATLADLQQLSGIGQKRAQDILDYRDSKGGFTSLDDLKNISGIGDKTFEKLKELVTID